MYKEYFGRNQSKLPVKAAISVSSFCLRKLKGIAKPNIEFPGWQSDESLRSYYSKCQALIFPGEEDFGIVPLEAQASGRPVIAYAKGGALETVIDGITGIFFKEQTADSLISAIKHFEKIKNNFDPKKIRKNAMRFDKGMFQERIKSFINSKYKEHFS